MKAIFAAATFVMVNAQAGECIKVEYQELKEWSEDQLIKKYCEDKKDFDSHTAVADFNQSVAETYRKMGDTANSARIWNKVSAASDSGKICKNEMDRIARILSQKGLEEPAVKSRCAEKS